MYFYILFILLIVLFMGNYTFNGQPKAQYLTNIGLGIIILVSILRFDVGWDYPSYYLDIYPVLDPISIAKYEPLNRVIYYITDYFRWPPLLFIIYGLLTYGLVFSTLKKYTPNLFLATLTYLAFFYNTSLGPIRQGLALGIVLYAYRYLITRAYLKYFISIVIAGMFHLTAFTGLLIPFLFYLMTPVRMIILLIVTILGYKYALTIISEYMGYATYLANVDEYSGGTLISLAYPIVIFSLCILTWKNKDLIAQRLTYVTIFGALCPFLLGGHIGGRIGWYFLIYLCILVPRALKHQKASTRTTYAGLFVGYFLLYVFITTLNPVKQPLTPYQSILTTNIDPPIFK